MDPAMAIEVAAMSRQRALEEATERGGSEMQSFYRDCSVFLTGGSGFMGKQLIEKLLRSCQISKIFVLLRSKKGKDIHERLAEMLKDPVFEPVRKKQPDFEAKLVPIEGDVADLRLGISDQDWETITDQVNVIYHLAATTRFDETLRVATLINVRGTREVVIMAKACTKLKSFVHVSTAYTQALNSKINQEVYEEFRPSPIPPQTLISMAESMEESRLNGITYNLIADWPNTYTFAKAVAEEVVRSMSDGLPICIVRPGVVIATHREPTPGWLDISCAYGASGLIIGVGLGVIHIGFNDSNTRIGLVPCDYVNNVIIAAGREASRSIGGDNTTIYTVSSSTRNPILYGQIMETMIQNKPKIMTPKAMYYCYGWETNNKLLFTFLTWFLHLIPAYMVDFVCLLLGKERRFVKIYKKVYNITNALEYFSINTWFFDDKNTENLYKSLSKSDKIIFDFDIPSVDWNEYLMIWCIGIRKYLIKDGLKNTKKAFKKQHLLRILHYILTVLYFYIFWIVFSTVYNVISHFLF